LEECARARHHLLGGDGSVCWDSHPLCARLRTAGQEQAMSLGNAALLFICVLLCGYLLYALLKAEEF
jgi:K+-transporting ATPase KdpF subunit